MKNTRSFGPFAMPFLNKTLLLSLVSSLIALGIHHSLHADNKIRVETPVAMVNGVVLSQNDLAMEMGLLDAEMDYRNRFLNSEERSELQLHLKELLIERELLYQQARKRNIPIQNRWVEREIDKLKARQGNTSSFKSYLDRAGMTQNQLKERIYKGLIVRRLLHRDVLRQIRVSENEVKSYYNQHPALFVRPPQVRARHIMIALSPAFTEEQRRQAFSRIKDIQTKIEQGSDFAVMALEHSDCVSKHRGGDLGFFSQSEVIAPISQTAFSLSPGQISDIITSRYGYHLIQLLTYRPFDPMAYKSTREKIERTIRRNKEKAATDAYLGAIKKKAVIIR